MEFALCALPSAAPKSPPRKKQRQTIAGMWQQAEKAENQPLPPQLPPPDLVTSVPVSTNPNVQSQSLKHAYNSSHRKGCSSNIKPSKERNRQGNNISSQNQSQSLKQAYSSSHRQGSSKERNRQGNNCRSPNQSQSLKEQASASPAPAAQRTKETNMEKKRTKTG